MESRIVPPESRRRTMSGFSPEHSARFLDHVGRSSKGRLRTKAILEDLEEIIPAWDGVRTIVDVGCGAAPVSLELLVRYEWTEAVLLDASPTMLAEAAASARALGVPESRYRCVCAPFEEWNDRWMRPLVLCHGVLGWVDSPKLFLDKLARSTAESGGVLSLLVGQRLGHLLSYAASGDIPRLEALFDADRVAGSGEGTSVRMFNRAWIEDAVRSHLRLRLSRGVRVLADLLPRAVPEDRLARLESAARRMDELTELGNMRHFVLESLRGSN